MEGNSAFYIQISTFHSFGLKILKENCELLGYEKNFTILDSDDSLSIIKKIMKELNIDANKYNPKAIKNVISNNKNQIIVGKDLANYLKLKSGDTVSLIARGSRGWLETAYFTMSGIYEFKNKNFDIYADTKTISNFIYLKSGNKSPYNESLLIFSAKSIYSDLMKNEILKDMDIIKFDKTE